MGALVYRICVILILVRIAGAIDDHRENTEAQLQSLVRTVYVEDLSE